MKSMLIFADTSGRGSLIGLRARNKADRRDRILDAAATLFREAGYEAARLDDIAERAAVSVGTVYNYFDTKGDILLAAVAMEVEEVLAQGARVVAQPPADVAEALDRLIGVYYDHSLTWLSKAMWRTAVAMAIQSPEAQFSRIYKGLDARLCAQVAALIARLQQGGVVRADLDPGALGEVIFNNLNAMFIEFVRAEPMTLPDLKAAVARQNAPLARLIATQA